MNELERLLEAERANRDHERRLGELRQEAAIQAISEVIADLKAQGIETLCHRGNEQTPTPIKLSYEGRRALFVHTAWGNLRLSAEPEEPTQFLVKFGYENYGSGSKTLFDGTNRAEAVTVFLKELVKYVK